MYHQLHKISLKKYLNKSVRSLHLLKIYMYKKYVPKKNVWKFEC